ncbi:hypothetical protein FPV67DRAFT_1452765 [Lyophyllum atratum]|nr:hypothetical protein FPV67DRAFT_1452765 [Lyophyllum atratum]
MVMLLRSGRVQERRACRCTPRPVVAAQPPDMGAHAYLFSTNRRKRSLHYFRFRPGSTRAQPLIQAHFRMPATERPDIYSARLDMGPHSFYLLGWRSEKAPPNLAIAAIMGEPFKGEVAVFSSGPLTTVHSRPRAPKEVVDRAARFFASRIEDAYSLGIPLNQYLRAPLEG